MSGDFDSFIEEHYEAAFCFALSLSRKHDDACDLTKQAFLIAQIKQSQLHDQTKAKQWLFTILYREFSRAKRHVMRSRFEAKSEVAVHPLISVDRAATIDAKNVLAGLLKLDDHFRLPVSLFISINLLTMKSLKFSPPQSAP